MDRGQLNNFFKRQTLVIVFCLVIILSGTIFISSAAFTVTRNSNITQTASTGNFNVTFAQGSQITNDVFVSTDKEGMSTTGYTFSVNNTGNIDSSYMILLGRTPGASGTLVSNQYIRYSLDNATAKTLTANDVYSGTSESNYLYKIDVGSCAASATKNHTLKVWLDSSTPNTILDSNARVNLSIKVEAVVANPTSDIGYKLSYTGNEQTYTVPYTGDYTITAYGAEGNVGNLYAQSSSTLKGGKGAKISGNFSLTKGDILHVIVGGMGSTTTGTSSDGAAGAGGGGTFIFKEIPSITDSTYQFTKNNVNYDVLLVAAGGGGTGDIGYSASYRSIGGYDANGADFKSPSNFTAFSTTSTTGSSSSTLGITQYINYNLVGGSYTRGSSVCTGGYGGGGCIDDQRTYGGGWSGANFVSYSWSQGQNTVGRNGYQTGNGYATIKFIN